MSSSWIRCAVAALAASLVACGGGGGPEITPIGDQVIAVGDRFELEIAASSAASGGITFSYGTNAPDLGDRAQLTVRPDGTGLFSWTPNARDVGAWTFDFIAVDASGRSTESILIDVRSAIGEASMPVFQRPLGSGTAVKMKENAGPGENCVTVEVAATDQDSTEVIFAEEPPRIEGAELFQETEFEAEWHWCPTDAQRRAQDRYILTLSASDGDNPKALKRYQIILRGGEKPSCPGAPPEVIHAAADQSTTNPLLVEARVSDESGLKAAPLIYFSTTKPQDPRDQTGMVQQTMELASGDSRSGTWRAELPNPLRGAPSTTLFYVIVAEDNDDSGGECDHVTTVPFQMTVTDPTVEQGGLGACERCTADSQCGEAGDNCLMVGTAGESFCFTACDGETCPSGYTCSAGPVTSVDGVSSRQCVPLDERCDGTGGCLDDRFEQNDGRSQAQPLEPGVTRELRMCPVGNLGADEDWYQLEVTADSRVTVAISGGTYPNMELSMVDAAGKLLAASEDWGSDDDVSRCLKPGTYYVRVYSYFSGENDYSIFVSTAPETCTDGGTCEDDPFEDDDRPDQARIPDFEDFQFSSTGNQICSGDDDWFFVHLFGNETLHGTLRFEQLSPAEDLDFLIYDGAGRLITRCTEDDPSGCDGSNGQSSSSNETLRFTAPASGDYYVVVHGWAGSERNYDICLALQPGICTL
jgi:hypothetical protein